MLLNKTSVIFVTFRTRRENISAKTIGEHFALFFIGDSNVKFPLLSNMSSILNKAKYSKYALNCDIAAISRDNHSSLAFSVAGKYALKLSISKILSTNCHGLFLI